MRPYLLKRRNLPLAVINLTEEGTITDYRLFEENMRFTPLHDPKNNGWLKQWWSRRAVPISQGHIQEMLKRRGLIGPEDYLVKNLGLSLTDYYWISPVDSGLLWEDVNLFDNSFCEDIHIARDDQDEPDEFPHYSPNASLQGTLEKCWTIRNGKRGMLKGNRDALSAESLNEVIASKIHELQGFENYLPYQLLEFHGKPYHYGCFSELFTSEKLELVSAYDVITSRKKPPEVNTYEHFIHICSENGLPEQVLRPFLEYQIMTDFIISNRDRHLSNISILRDAESLEFVSPAPIYDSGRALFVADSVPASEKDFLKIQTDSFAGTEIRLLSYVTGRTLVNISKLPDPGYVRGLYLLDGNMTESRINDIVRGYEQKIRLFTKWQNGEELFHKA